jgi:alkyl hydroperoxide reductase subunit F
LSSQLKGAKKLTVFLEHETKEIKGRELVDGIRIKDAKSGEEKELEVGGVFIEIGLVPNSDAVKKLVRLNKWGEVTVTPRNETSVPGLYSAGDVTDVPEKQILVAAGEGAKAALQAHRYLQRLVK